MKDSTNGESVKATGIVYEDNGAAVNRLLRDELQEYLDEEGITAREFAERSDLVDILPHINQILADDGLNVPIGAFGLISSGSFTQIGGLEGGDYRAFNSIREYLSTAAEEASDV